MDTSWDDGVPNTMFESLLTLTSDHISRIKHVQIICSMIFLGRNHDFCVWMHLGMEECSILFLGHLTSDLLSRIIMSRAYLLYHLS